jgi:gamma-glutamyl:cysteine ligase YbdK (ATP-grasp superfamily)
MQLQRQGQPVALRDWAQEILRELQPVAQALDQAQLKRFVRGKQFAFHQVRLCAGQTQESGHFGDTCGTGDQAQGHFRQAQGDL